jgi:hypothetical protein
LATGSTDDELNLPFLGRLGHESVEMARTHGDRQAQKSGEGGGRVRRPFAFTSLTTLPTVTITDILSVFYTVIPVFPGFPSVCPK